MTLSSQEREEALVFYDYTGSLRGASKLTGWSPWTIKKYVEPFREVQSPNIVTGLKTKDERLIGLYVGLWIGDGTQFIEKNRYVVKICTNQDQKKLNTFMIELIERLFGKRPFLTYESNRKSAYVKLYSKFIFEFVRDYCEFGKDKAKSVRLASPVDCYTDRFLEGVLLGLMLSDGHLNVEARFNVISKDLSENMSNVLRRFGFESYVYVHDRRKYGWNNLFLLQTSRTNVAKLEMFLDEILSKVGCSFKFRELKQEKVMSPP